MTNPYPATHAPAPPPRAFRIGDPLVLLGALAVLGFSFAPFVRLSDQAEQSFVMALLGTKPWFNAWSLETFMAPLTGFVVLAGLLAAGAATSRFLLRRDPELLGFRLRQFEVGLTLFGFFVLLGLIASDKHAVFGARRLAEADPGFDAGDVAMVAGWGAVLMLIGAGTAALGAVLNHFSVGPVVPIGAGGLPPPPPGYWPGGAPQPPGLGYPTPPAPPPADQPLAAPPMPDQQPSQEPPPRAGGEPPPDTSPR